MTTTNKETTTVSTTNRRTATMTNPATGQRYTAHFCEQNHPHLCVADRAACDRVGPTPILSALMDEVLR